MRDWRSGSARPSGGHNSSRKRAHTRPAAQPDCPSPPPARASCHVAQGRGARLCGAGPRGGPEPGSASSPPPPDRLNLHERGPMVRASFLGPESQSDDEARPAAGKTTPPEEGEGGRPLAREPLSLTLPPLPRPARGRPRPHVQLASPHLPPAPPSGQSEAAGGCALRRPLTDRRLAPTKTRHLCFHTRREEKKPISDEKSTGSAPLPPPGSHGRVRWRLFRSLLPPPPVAAGRTAFLPATRSSLPASRLAPGCPTERTHRARRACRGRPVPANTPSHPPARGPIPYLAEAL